MKYLLDTNIFIFLLNKEDSKLTKRQMAIIQDDDNELFISEASFYEIAIKIRTGRMDFSHISLERAEKFRKKVNLKMIKSTFEHYENLVSISKILKKDGKPHADPFDLLIISTPQTENLPVLSSDEYFPDYPEIQTI